MTREDALKSARDFNNMLMRAREGKGAKSPYTSDTSYICFGGNSPRGYQLEDLLKYIEKAPTLPQEPTDELLQAMLEGYTNRERSDGDSGWLIRIMNKQYKALHAALTAPPKSKTKKVWCLSYKVGGSFHTITRSTKEAIERERAACVGSTVRHEYSFVSPIWEEEVPC